MDMRPLPDLHTASKPELVEAWRRRGRELTDLAAQHRRDGDFDRARDLEAEAEDYFIDADDLEAELNE